MKKLSEKFRRILRAIFICLGMGTASFASFSCSFSEPMMYGMPPDWSEYDPDEDEDDESDEEPDAE